MRHLLHRIRRWLCPNTVTVPETLAEQLAQLLEENVHRTTQQ